MIATVPQGATWEAIGELAQQCLTPRPSEGSWCRIKCMRMEYLYVFITHDLAANTYRVEMTRAGVDKTYKSFRAAWAAVVRLCLKLDMFIVEIDG